MKSMQKISFLVVCGLWISTTADAMNSYFVFNNQKSQSSFVRRQISEQENIDPNTYRPAKQSKIEDFNGFNKCDSNPLFTPKKVEAGEVLGHLVEKKKPFTQEDIRKVIEKKISERRKTYDENKLRKIIDEAVEMIRCIGNDQNGNTIYWVKIKNYQKQYKMNFLHPIICSSESNEWKSAAQEWEVMYYGEVEGTTCICGKEEIKYVSGILNRLNGNELYPIGSRCINKFESEEMNEDIHAYEKAFNKISNGISKLKESVKKGESIKFTSRLFSEELINYLNKKEILSDSDCQFLLDMRGRISRNSEQQERINKIIEDFIVPYISGISQDEKIIIDRQMLE